MVKSSNYQIITSKDNPIIKLTKKLSAKKDRKENNLFIIEGEKLVAEALTSNLKIKYLFLKEGFSNNFDVKDNITYHITPSLMSHIATTDSPPPCLAVAEIFDNNKDFDSCDFLLILDGLQDAGNFGTIIRTAEATGVDLIVCSNNTVDLFNPKVIRSAMGSAFRQPITYANDLNTTIEELLKKDFQIVMTSSYATKNYFSVEFNKKTALFLGNEGNGISKDLLNKYTSVKIPMFGKVESLNVSIATSILLYEIAKQKFSVK